MGYRSYVIARLGVVGRVNLPCVWEVWAFVRSGFRSHRPRHSLATHPLAMNAAACPSTYSVRLEPADAPAARTVPAGFCFAAPNAAFFGVFAPLDSEPNPFVVRGKANTTQA